MSGDQYSMKGILRYEWIFGHGFLGYGEPGVTRKLIENTKWPSGCRVLDVGSGLGGPAFLMACEHDARVTGVDLTKATVDLARQRRDDQGITGVEFIQGDIHHLVWPPESFDVVWSRETLLHVPDKEALFRKFHRWLSPGGALVITDYARRRGRGSDRFEDYVEASGYPLPELDRYRQMLTDAGFVDVSVQDRSETLADLLGEQLEKLETNRAEFCETFSPEDCEYLKERWQLKLDCCRDGDLKWGWFTARKERADG